MQTSAFGRLDRPACVVLFAGLGGSCEGIRRALGVSPIAAVNHCAHAIDLHARNHPETAHYREDVWTVPLRELTRGRHLSLLWLSPDCTHHSRAKGAAPRDTGRRSLADAVFRWTDASAPDVVMLENVPEWMDWGPLDSAGRAIAAERGVLFRGWVSRLQAAGYRVEWRVLAACDYGAPTSRERVYLIARRDGRPIVWPTPTHGAGLLPYRTAAECIDWALPWTRDIDAAPLCAKSMNRINVGRMMFDGAPFLIEYYGTGLAASLDKPLHTITTKDRFGLVSGSNFRMLQPRELARAMGFPDSYVLDGPKSEQVARIGNAVCPPVAEALVSVNMRGI